MDVGYSQKKVKCYSKCLTFWAYILMITGALNIVANVFFIFVIDSFTTISWIDRNEKYQSIKLDPGFLFLLAFAKIIGFGFLQYKQGSQTLSVFKPILKEYKDAETGVTQGIPIGHNRSKFMHALKGFIWKITAGLIFIVFVTLLIVKSQAETKATEYIEMKYAEKAGLENGTKVPVDFSIDLAKTFGKLH
jgi:hypothetical protein